MSDTIRKREIESDIAAFADPGIERRLISLGFYDGTTNGLIELGGSRSFRYDLISWDENQDKRVYCIGPLPPSAFQKALDVLRSLGEPRWPVWNPLWKFENEEAQMSAQRALDEILGPAEYHISVITADLSQPGGRVIPLTGEALRQATKFGIDRELQPFPVWLRVA